MSEDWPAASRRQEREVAAWELEVGRILSEHAVVDDLQAARCESERSRALEVVVGSTEAA